MRIVFVTTNDHVPTGGSEALWSQTAVELVRNGVEIAICAREWEPPPAHIKALLDEGCPFFARARPLGGFFQRQWNKLGNKMGIGEAEQFGRWLNRIRPDLVVFSHGSPFEAYDYINQCIKKDIKYALLIQVASDDRWLHGREAVHYQRAYQNAVKCFFVAKANHLLLEKILGVELEHATVVQNPCNVQFHRPFHWDGLSHDKVCLAHVGNLDCRHKGQDILLEVMRQEKWRGRNVEISLFGDGVHGQLIDTLIRKWNLTNITLRGFVDNIENVWDSHHALVMPSRMEGTPLALVEAQLCGRLAIATDVGGNAEILKDGINGFLAAAATPQLFDEALERAWYRRPDWQDMGYSAYELAHSRISPNPAKDFSDHVIRLAESHPAAEQSKNRAPYLTKHGSS